jgi:thiol-disulfide isomerase/thioredoxin
MTSSHKRLVALPVVAALSLGIVGGTYYVVNRAAIPPSAREQVMNELTLTLTDGSTLDVSQFEEEPIIVVSWATWCSLCRGVLDTASAVQTHFGDRVTVIAVNRKEDESIVRDFRAAFPLPENIIYTRDDADAYYLKSGGQGMPEVVVYDSKGNLALHLLSIPTKDELINAVTPLFES